MGSAPAEAVARCACYLGRTACCSLTYVQDVGTFLSSLFSGTAQGKPLLSTSLWAVRELLSKWERGSEIQVCVCNQSHICKSLLKIVMHGMKAFEALVLGLWLAMATRVRVGADSASHMPLVTCFCSLHAEWVVLYPPPPTTPMSSATASVLRLGEIANLKNLNSWPMLLDFPLSVVWDKQT